MKKSIFALIFVFLSFNIIAQINVGNVEMVKFNAGKLLPEDIELLKSTQTIFVCKDSDDVISLQNEIKKVWTITPIKVVKFSEFNFSSVDSKTSVISISGYEKTATTTTLSWTNVHVYLKLWMQSSVNSKEIKTLARIELYPNSVNNTDKSLKKLSVDYFYNQAKLFNWEIGILKNYLKFVNDHLTNQETSWLYQNVIDKESLKPLVNGTLYIVDYTLIKTDPQTGDMSKRFDEKEILEGYAHKYKLISAEELSKMIVTSNSTFYYLIFTKSSTDTYYTIFNSKTGQIIYNKYKPISYNASSVIFKEISRSIK